MTTECCANRKSHWTGRDCRLWWAEYDAAAKRMASGWPMPTLMSVRCRREIKRDPEAFSNRVTDFCYGFTDRAEVSP